MSELKPCPFCGGEAELQYPEEMGDNRGTVMCTKCYASTSDKENWKDAIEAWNTRTSPEVDHSGAYNKLAIDIDVLRERFNDKCKEALVKDKTIQSQQAEIEQWKANHADVVARNRILSQREDLPVDRLPAHKELERSQARVKELEAALGHIANIGGNIPDEALEAATGPNDAAYRGGMLVSCREAAKQALSQSEQGEVSPWQPIATAPKDGTRVLVVLDSGKMSVASFCKKEGWQAEGQEADNYTQGFELDGNPTHWMPLPPAPEGDR
jgi:Lar family restriction alleviation protein